MVPLLLLRPGFSPGRVRRTGLYVLISATPLALWLLRNHLVTGTFTGNRAGLASGPFLREAGRGLSSMEAWNPLLADLRAILVPLDEMTGRMVGAVLAGAVLFALALVVLRAALRWSRDDGGYAKLACLTIAGAYAFGHIAFTGVSVDLYGFLSERQLVPAYAPLVVVVTIASEMLIDRLRRLPIRRRGLWPVRFGPSPSAVVTGALVVCTAYAAWVGVRDTWAAVVTPEYGLNAATYNAENLNVETTSLGDYLRERVGDAFPVARDHFDVYLDDGTLIYFRQGCSREEFARMIDLRVVPENKLVLSGIRKNFGMDILSFFPARQGAMLDGDCLALAPLPTYRAEFVATGQSEDGAKLWEATFRP